MVILTLLPAAGHADTKQSSTIEKISLQIVSSDANGNYGYTLQYYVSAPIKTFWHFKIDFETDILLTSDELIGHRLVKTAGNSVVTENRYMKSTLTKVAKWEQKIALRYTPKYLAAIKY